MLRVAWSVCRSQLWAQQKRLNWLRCHFVSSLVRWVPLGKYDPCLVAMQTGTAITVAACYNISWKQTEKQKQKLILHLTRASSMLGRRPKHSFGLPGLTGSLTLGLLTNIDCSKSAKKCQMTIICLSTSVCDECDNLLPHSPHYVPFHRFDRPTDRGSSVLSLIRYQIK